MYFDNLNLQLKADVYMPQSIKLTGKVGNRRLLLFGSVDDFVSAFVYDRIIELEFFCSSEKLRIDIYDSYGCPVFQEITETVATLHFIIGAHNWSCGTYFIKMTNNDGVSISGDFNL